MSDIPPHSLSDIDRVVHEPARFMILSQLYVVDAADFIFVMRQIGLTQGNLSSHLARLEEAGYVGVQKEFVDKRPRTLLRLTDQGRTAFEEYVARMKRLLDGVPVQDANRPRRRPLRHLRPKPATQ